MTSNHIFDIFKIGDNMENRYEQERRELQELAKQGAMGIDKIEKIENRIFGEVRNNEHTQYIGKDRTVHLASNGGERIKPMTEGFSTKEPVRRENKVETEEQKRKVNRQKKINKLVATALAASLLFAGANFTMTQIKDANNGDEVIKVEMVNESGEIVDAAGPVKESVPIESYDLNLPIDAGEYNSDLAGYNLVMTQDENYLFIDEVGNVKTEINGISAEEFANSMENYTMSNAGRTL